ncbi:MAG: hypothetical protein MUP47_09205 [Phycisphaerae bacterium]|nr:hypothetical protein [Phycisphaerae bacterium]
MREDWIESALTMPGRVTSACAEFLCQHVAHNEFVDHISRTAGFADVAASTVLKLSRTLRLTKRPNDPEVEEEKGAFARCMQIFEPLLAEMVWCRGVDNFLIYISRLLGLVFRTRPETLRSGKTEYLDVVLSFESMEALIDHLAEKRVHDLAYEGLASLQDTLEKEIGFSLFTNAERLKRAIVIVETRHLIVHNRAIVNDLFRKRTGADWAKPGDKNQVGLICAGRCLRFLAAAVLDIDARGQQKFSLESVDLQDKCQECVTSADSKVCANQIWSPHGEARSPEGV